MCTIGALILTLRSARVQTAAVAVVTQEIAQALHVKAHIDGVEIRPPLAMDLQGVFLSDQHGDTLLAVPSLCVRFNPFALEDKQLSFPLLRLSQPTICLVQDSAGTNLDFLFKAFSGNQSNQPFSYSVNCKKIEINDARVHYIHRPSNTDIMLTDIHTDVGLLYCQDSLQTMLRAIHAKAQLQPVQGYLEADFHGSLDTLYADQMKVVYRGKQIFDGDVCVIHPLQRDVLYTLFNCKDLTFTASDLSSLLSDVTQSPVQLPSSLTQLGRVHYRGRIAGRLDDLKLHGAFRTKIGSVSTNVRLLNLKEAKGQISTTNLALGQLLNTPNLGNLSASLTMDGNIYDSIPQLNMDGWVTKLECMGYTYTNISLKAECSAQEEVTNLTIDDPNLQLQLNSHLTNWNTKAPSLDMDIRAPHINLATLHLTDSALEHRLSFTSSVRLHVDSTLPNLVDATMGSIIIDSLHVSGAGHELLAPRVDILVEADSAQRHMSITSSVLTANMDGHFQWTSIPATVYGFIHRSLPSLTPAPDGHDYTNDMDFKADILQMDAILNVLGIHDVHFPTTPQLSGFVHESDSSFAIRVFADHVIKNNVAYQNLVLALDNDNPLRNATGGFYIQQHIIEKDSTRFRIGDMMAAIQLTAHNDSITTAIEFGDLSEADSVPDMLIHTTVEQHQGAPWIDVHFMPSDFQLGRAQWHIDDAHVTYCAADTVLEVKQLGLHTPQQMLMIDGKMSKHLHDSLLVQIKEVDLGYLLSSTQILDVVDFSGGITGWATLYGAFSTPQFEANVAMQDAQINHVPVGCVSATAELDRTNGEVIIRGKAVQDSVQIALVNGRVVTGKSPSWEVNIDSNGMPLAIINFWTKGIIEQLAGRAYGNFCIFGRNMDTWVTVQALAKDAAMTVPATGCRYYFTDSIILDSTYIDFPSVHLKDAQGHEGFLTGRINHTFFKHFQYQINVQCDRILALDLPANPQNVYYGQAYANGNVTISGNDYATYINVDASTSANTDFYLSLATATTATSSEFITFKQPQLTELDTIVQQLIPKSNVRLFVNLVLDVTPQAKVHLVLDEHNGDGIVGRGEGNIRFNMDASSGEIKMLGTYTLRNGTFSYTVGNLIHRDFMIAEGSTISWSGNPANPQLDITAKYRCTASLRDLFGADAKSITSRPSIPVDCVIRVTGEMNNMILKFGIEFPQSDESVAAQINSVINTEAMLMRQVIYLLVFNRFYTPDNMRTANTGLNDAYSLLSSTVTGQINSWLSKLTSMVNVGFNMRANMEQGNQSYETEANIQIQPIDRLTINGNVGYRYNDISNQPFFGDADIEYELTANGKLRAKAFTHSVDKYSLHQSGMQSGIGFIFRHDFNPGDAKKRREQKKAETSKHASKL